MSFLHRKKMLLIGLFIFIIISVPITIYLTQQRQDNRQRASSKASTQIIKNVFSERSDITSPTDIVIDFTEPNTISPGDHIVILAAIKNDNPNENNPEITNIIDNQANTYAKIATSFSLTGKSSISIWDALISESSQLQIKISLKKEDIANLRILQIRGLDPIAPVHMSSTNQGAENTAGFSNISVTQHSLFVGGLAIENTVDETKLKNIPTTLAEGVLEKNIHNGSSNIPLVTFTSNLSLPDKPAPESRYDSLFQLPSVAPWTSVYAVFQSDITQESTKTFGRFWCSEKWLTETSSLQSSVIRIQKAVSDDNFSVIWERNNPNQNNLTLVPGEFYLFETTSDASSMPNNSCEYYPLNPSPLPTNMSFPINDTKHLPWCGAPITAQEMVNSLPKSISHVSTYSDEKEAFVAWDRTEFGFSGDLTRLEPGKNYQFTTLSGEDAVITMAGGNFCKPIISKDLPCPYIGDIDRDNKITEFDLIHARSIVNEVSGYTASQRISVDLNNDSAVSTLDLVPFIQFLSPTYTQKIPACNVPARI